MTMVLRKSYGPHSAGTRVEVVSHNHTNDIDPSTPTVLVWFPGGKEAEEIETDMLVTLRNRSDVVPAVARINRPERLARRQLWMMFNSAKRGD